MIVDKMKFKMPQEVRNRFLSEFTENMAIFEEHFEITDHLVKDEFQNTYGDVAAGEGNSALEAEDELIEPREKMLTVEEDWKCQ